MTADLRNDIRRYILENYLFTDDDSALGFEDSLLEQGIVDSTGVLEIIYFLEENLGVKVEDEEMVPENFESVERISRFVESKRAVA